MRQNIGYRMANRFADAQLSLRAAGRGTLLLLVAGHRSKNHLVMPGVRAAGIGSLPVETNETSMAGAAPAIAFSQFQFKKIRALR
jgi:hypothetical protein